MSLDPITFAVIKSALDAIVDEMAYAVIRTARSEIIRDVMDYSAALCDAEGRMVAQAKTIAQHLGAVPDAMQSVHAGVRRRPASRRRRGDERSLRRRHAHSRRLPLPADLRGRRAGGASPSSSATRRDMGGRVPGSNASDSTEIYQEGLRIPPVKLYERGVLSRTVRRIIEKNVRVPERVLGDLGRAVRGVQGRRARARQALRALRAPRPCTPTSPSSSTMPSASRAPRSRAGRGAPTVSPTTSIATASATTPSRSRWPSPCTTTATSPATGRARPRR